MDIKSGNYGRSSIAPMSVGPATPTEGSFAKFGQIEIMRLHPPPGSLKESPRANLETRLAQMFVRAEGTPDNREDNVYATVVKNGQVLAKIYNTGPSEMRYEAAAVVRNLQDPDLSGPALAQWRAERYAEFLGAEIEKSPHALSQSEWEKRPLPQMIFDAEAMNEAFEAWESEAHARQSEYNRTGPSQGLSRLKIEV